MPKENIFYNGLKPVESENIVICLKCSRKNEVDADRCTECSFPLKDASLTKVVPIEFLTQRR